MLYYYHSAVVPGRNRRAIRPEDRRRLRERFQRGTAGDEQQHDAGQSGHGQQVIVLSFKKQ